jgi:hypothetical protein
MTTPADSFFATLQNVVTAINNIGKTLSGAFAVQVTGVSSTATTGSLTFNSSQPATFVVLTSSNGTIVKVPGYND